MVKNLSAMQETQVQSPSQEDPLEKRMATHSSIFAWDISWTESLAKSRKGVAKSSNGVAKSRTRMSD